MDKCWICGSEYQGECPTCGAPLPWGPTEDELAEDYKREPDERDWYDDSTYARDVCVPRWGEI